MRVDVFPRQAEVIPGQQQVVSITVTNTATVIGGYAIRLLGADPGWVQLEVDEISLFPDESRTLTATITPPTALPAGTRRVAVQVRELTPPNDHSITEIDLTVPAARSVQLRIDPLTVTAGRSATFSAIAENTGNTMLSGHLDGADPEGKVGFEFRPSWISLAPGEHAVVDVRTKARRHLAGTPAVRVLGFFLDEQNDPFFGDETPPPGGGARDDRPPLANATFVQRAVFSRGGIALLGLLVSITVFAVVITIALSRLVGQSAADRDLALQVAEARNAAGSGGTSGIAGTVRQLTSKQPEAGVSVSAFTESDTNKPVATTATDKKGAYHFEQLAAGKYKLSYRGAGFVQVWYPAAATDADASLVTVTAGQQKTGVNVTLGGVPATISGTVTGDDVSAATLYLESAVGAGADEHSARPLTRDPGSPPANPVPDDGNAVVQTVPIGSDGTFALSNVPSPSVYELVVTKTGYATSTQRLDVAAGEKRTGVQIELRKGDGLISGTVSSPSGPIGGATITATTGQSSVSTVSLTDVHVGSFTLRSLPTPGTYTLVARKPGFSPQTLSLALSPGQKLTGVSVSLGRSSGSLGGVVMTAADDKLAGGVSVTVTDGLHTVRTESESSGSLGTWHVGGLPVPGTYTITLSRADLAAQTVSASLDESGHITPGSGGARVDADGNITVSMLASTATVFGTVTQPGRVNSTCGGNRLGEATISLNSGSNSYAVTSASRPAERCGDYRVEHLPPGTYTLTVAAGSGTTPSSVVFTLHAGDVVERNVALSQPASVAGTVLNADGAPLSGWSVFLYAAADYPGQVTQIVRTANDGSFSFAGVDAGTYVVAAGPSADAANAAVTERITVQPSKRTRVTVRVSQ